MVEAPPRITADKHPRYINIPKFLPASIKSSEDFALMEPINPAIIKTAKYMSITVVSNKFIICPLPFNLMTSIHILKALTNYRCQRSFVILVSLLAYK
jgi:hypothetical protein